MVLVSLSATGVYAQVPEAVTGAGEAARAAPKADTAKTDTGKPIAKPEPAKADAAKVEPAKADAAKTEPAKADAAKADAANPAAKPEATKAEAPKPAVKPEAAKPDAAKPDASKANSTGPDAVRAETAKPNGAAADAKAAPRPAETPDGGGSAGKFAPTPIVSTPSGTPAEKQKWLKDQIDAALGDPGLAGAKIGIAVAEVETGKALYSRNDGGLFNPASDTKLFTTAAALALLGPE